MKLHLGDLFELVASKQFFTLIFPVLRSESNSSNVMSAQFCSRLSLKTSG